MRTDPRRWWAVVLVGSSWLGGLVGDQAAAQPAPADPPPNRYAPTDAERAEIIAKLAGLDAAIVALRAKVGDGASARDALADVEVCRKGAAWALRFGEFFEAKDVARITQTLAKGIARAAALQQGQAPWTNAVGGVVRGFRSAVDGSIQPYAVIVPTDKPGGGSGDDRLRLDVVLHGRDARIQEARFFDAHDGKPAAEGQPGLILHVFGRGNNAYRWAGETDVNEAIAAVQRNYWVDDRRVVLRGFSMGGAGAWHLGLHEPSRWSSVEAGAGFTETIRYAHLQDPSATTSQGLRVYDAVDSALNAFNVPIVAYGGENDPQAQASKNILDALVALGVPMKTDGLVTRAEGVDFTRIIGRGMRHAVDKESAGLMRAFHADRAARGAVSPTSIRFVTYTLKYPRVGWLKIHRLVEHYRRTTLEAGTDNDVATVRTENVAVVAVAREAGESVRLDGQELPLREAAGGLLPDVYYQKSANSWQLLDHDASRAIQENARGEKRPGLQGPIDDAFTDRFVCVRGTGTPHHPRVQAWADARLAQFAEVWARSMRGDLRIIDDIALTDDDAESSHLILFGDPGSNRAIAQFLPDLPLTWTPTTLKLAESTFDPATHAPALITVHPKNHLRYVVINSGHTFGAKEFVGSNALLYPRLGDRAVIRVASPSDPKTSDEVVLDGYFNERWR